MSGSSIDDFYNAHVEVINYLIDNGQPSYASEANDNFRRSLVLAIASYFEHEISGIVRALPAHHAQGNPFLVTLVEQKAVSRQYHTYFDWKGTNANQFFAMFGAGYKATCQKKFNDEAEFKEAVQAFISLGHTRNLLVHENYVRFDVDKTPEDIIDLFRKAQTFVSYVRVTLLPKKAGAATDEQ